VNTTDIVLELSRIGRELDALSHDIDRLDRAAVAAWSEHRKAYARAYIDGTGSIEDRKQHAVLEVEELRVAAESADQVLRSAKERIRVLRDRLEIGRSISAARRAEFAAEPVGQAT
jgi:Xaa-Pro aminopeptidase